MAAFWEDLSHTSRKGHRHADLRIRQLMNIMKTSKYPQKNLERQFVTSGVTICKRILFCSYRSHAYEAASNIIDAYEVANLGSNACLRTLLAKTTVEVPRWSCDRHLSSSSSSTYLSSINKGSSTLCCYMDKDLPPLPWVPSAPFVPVPRRPSSLRSTLLPELPTSDSPSHEQFYSHRISVPSPLSPTRASSGVFAELATI